MHAAVHKLTGCSSAFAAVAGPGCASHAECEAVHRLLRDTLRDGPAAEQWREQCALSFRWSRYFGGEDCVPLEDKGVNGVADAVGKLAV